MRPNQLIMKSFLFFIFMLIVQGVFAQKADDIIGTWLTGNKKANIQIYKTGDKYYGKLVWIKEPNENGKPKLDKNNSDANKRNMPLLGIVNLNNFVFDDDEWTDGTIYDPENGKVYSCTMTLEGGKLHVRGYIGISLIGRTDVWERVK